MSLTLQYCSDLHLEFENNARRMHKYPLIPAADILLLGGDIVPFTHIEQHAEFFDWVSRSYKAAYWIPGNHEYYHGDINVRSGTLHEAIRDNVFLVNNTTIPLGDTDLMCSTLWSSINPANSWAINRAMSDFHVIADGAGRLGIDRYNALHQQCLQYITHALTTSTAAHKVVLTHHVPTLMNYPPKYKGDILNEAFATELHDLIEASGVHSWIYGHTHYNTPAFTIGIAQLLSNQLGYVQHGEHSTFVRDKVIVI